MASTSSDESVSLSKKDIYKKQLVKLECPFTWEMDDIDKSVNTEYNPHDEEESIPFLKMLRVIMTVYVDAKDENRDVDSILDNLKKCDDDYRALKNRANPEISTKVAYAVLQATKCFVYFKLNMEKELELLLRNLENIENMTNKEKSTLLACKSICWSKYHRIGSCDAEQLIREAIKLNGRCDIWHYILGKNIRRQRRDSAISSTPGREEARSFLKAYEISKNPIYGIFVAQMYRESKDYRRALSMYEDIFESFDSLSNTVLLRLALGFINLAKFGKAKACLDKAEEDCAKHSMYLHYRGIYHMKKKQFAEAARYFKEAIKDQNLPAERQYLECMINSQQSFNATQYLLDMLNKYETLPEKQLQSLILDVAFSYWKREHNLKEALRYFLHAIEIDPQSSSITNFYNNDVRPIKERNAYVFLKKFILPVIDQQRSRFDEETMETVAAIKEFCKIHDEARMNTIGNALTRIKIKKESEMESTNNNKTVLGKSKDETYLKRLLKLECPFTWDMDMNDESVNKEYNQSPHEEENRLPLQKLMSAVMKVYFNTKDGKTSDDVILGNLEKCDYYYEVLTKSADPEISTKVSNAVLQATKCFAYFKLNMEEKLDLTLKYLENIDDISDKEESTLFACKSICWSRYRRFGSVKAEHLIREAIKLNEHCGLWHYILGKVIRRQRRALSTSDKPGSEEVLSFLKAYSSSKNPIYGIFVAQMYRESEMYSKASDLYDEIYESVDSLSNKVLLRLALGLISQNEFEKGKVCLDKAEKSCPKRSMYLHYRGIYHMKKGEYQEASDFFKEAIKEDNLHAEKQYLQCLLKCEKSFDATKYLEDMMNKWNTKLPEKEIQPLILDVAFSYWQREHNWEKAIENFLRALKIDPKA